MTIARELRDLVRLRGGDVSKVPDVIADNVRALKKLEQAEVDAGYTEVTPTPEYEAVEPLVEYEEVTPEGTENPSNEGWYERSGTEGEYVYTVTTDQTVDETAIYYEAVYPENPKTSSWYERSGTEGSYVYTATTDTSVDTSKTYYMPTGEYEENPSTEGWFEKRSNGTYFESEDTEVDAAKTYYEANV